MKQIVMCLALSVFSTAACIQQPGLDFEYSNFDGETAVRLDCALLVVEWNIPHFSASGTIELVPYNSIVGYWTVDKDIGYHGDMYIRLAGGDMPSVKSLAKSFLYMAGWSDLEEETLEQISLECE